MTSSTLDLPVAHAPAPTAPARCPFHDGVLTLDALLAELDPRETALFDAVLDLRSLCTAREDAGACVAQLCRVRALLDARHYLAFYRVRCWARRALRVEVRAGRGAPWIAREFPLDGARCDEIVTTALASLAAGGAIPAAAHARFTFVC